MSGERRIVLAEAARGKVTKSGTKNALTNEKLKAVTGTEKQPIKK